MKNNIKKAPVKFREYLVFSAFYADFCLCPNLVIITISVTITQCIFDFEIRKKQMFTEARAFSRVTYF